MFSLILRGIVIVYGRCKNRLVGATVVNVVAVVSHYCHNGEMWVLLRTPYFDHYTRPDG